MRRIGDEHLHPFRIAVVLVVGAHDQHTGQFAVGAGSRLEGDSRKAGDLLEPFLQVEHQHQVALHGLDGLERMGEGKTGQAGHVFVDLGVVLHGAGTQRIEAAIHAVVVFGKVRKMAHHVGLGQFGQG